MQKIKDFLDKKGRGFYFSAAAAILAVILFVAYLIGYAGSMYITWSVPLLVALSFISFASMTAFDKTAPYAPIALLVLAFGGLCCYIGTIHVYVAASFPDGVNWESIAKLSPAFFITLILFLAITVLGHIGVYMKQTKTEAVKKASGDAVCEG